MGVDCDVMLVIDVETGKDLEHGMTLCLPLGFRWTLVSNGLNRHEAEPWLSLASQARHAEWKGVGQYGNVM